MDLIVKIKNEESFLINKKIIDRIQIDRTINFDIDCAIANINTNICCLGKDKCETSKYDLIEITQNELKTYSILKNKNLHPIINLQSLESLHSFEILFADYLDFYKKQHVLILDWFNSEYQGITINNWIEMIALTIINQGIFNDYETIELKNRLIENAFGNDVYEYNNFEENFRKLPL